jgi:TetR/AcrR family transcriptional regulator, repressor of fatR-cypB operon
MDTATTTGAKGSDKREAILDAAMELFAERGFHGTAVPLVAEKAGVGAGTIYRHFESKEALVNALFQREKARLGTAILKDFPWDKPARQQFSHFWRAQTRHAAESRVSMRFLELHHHGSYLDDKSRALELDILGQARAFFVNTTQQQVTKDLPPELLFAVVWGSFCGMMRAHWDGYMELSPQIIENAENCVWEAIRR